jgi:hypothetical protein
MIKPIFLFAVFLMGPGVLLAADKPAAQDLLASAAHQAWLLQDAPRPFEMEVDFTAEFDTPRQGHLRLRWEAKDRWWSKLTVGPFEQTKFQDGERTYTSRNVDFTPIQVRDLMDLLHVAKSYDKLVVRKDHPRTDQSVALDCMQTERRDLKNDRRHEICVNASTHEIVSETWNFGDDKMFRKQFSNFADFAEHRYPRRLELLKNGKVIIAANVMELKETPFDPQLLVPSQGAIERRECPDIKPPSVVSQGELIFVGRSGLRGSSRVEITVLADGKLGGVYVLESGGPVIDNMVVDAIRRSIYKPAMCGTEPVVADMDIEMGIWMGN